MTVSGVSSSLMASSAAALPMRMSVAVLKESISDAKLQAEALLKLIEETAAASSPSQHLDTYA